MITVARAKLALQDVGAEYDAALTTLVNAATTTIENWCRRSFVLSERAEIRISPGAGILILRHIPVVSLTRVSWARDVALEIRNQDTNHQRATVVVGSTGLSLIRVTEGTTVVDNSVTWVLYPTIASVAAAVNILGNGWSASVIPGLETHASVDLCPNLGPLPCLQQSRKLLAFSAEVENPRLMDAQAGMLLGDYPHPPNLVRLQYQSGYATIPEDVQQACAILVAEFFQLSRHDGSLSHERLGDYEYSTRAYNLNSALTPNLRVLLAPYRDYGRP